MRPTIAAAIWLTFASGAKGSGFFSYWNCQSEYGTSNKTHVALVYPLCVQVMQDTTFKDVTLTSLSTSTLHSLGIVWCCPYCFVAVHKIIFSDKNLRYWGYINSSSSIQPGAEHVNISCTYSVPFNNRQRIWKLQLEESLSKLF